MNTKLLAQRFVTNIESSECYLRSVITSYIFLIAPILGGCGPKAPSLSDVIRVSVRQSSLNSATAVLQIQSKHSEPLPLWGAVLNVDSNQRRDFEIGTLEPYQSVEVGMLEIGWAFEPNEVFIIATTPDLPYQMIRFHTYRTDSGSIGIRPSK